MRPGNFRATLLVGTQKGLFCIRSDHRREQWEMDGPHIVGYEITHAWLHPKAPRLGYAAANHPVWGAHIYRSADGGRSWCPLPAVPCHSPGEYRSSLDAVWFVAAADREDPGRLYAGIDPPGLFSSADGGESWTPLMGLNRHPTRHTWEPARGGFAVHSIYSDPSDSNCVYAAVSAGGAFRSNDKGLTWIPINRGVRAENIPRPHPETGHNIHRLVVHPTLPGRLYRQCYNGTYRSDDRGATWIEITAGLPSDFGYAIAAAPEHPDVVYVIPEDNHHVRTTAGANLRVYRSRDAGASWQAMTHGLPQEHVYVTVLREALATDGLDPGGVYFGTSSGHLFASRDTGDHWTLIASYLPRILSVQVNIHA